MISDEVGAMAPCIAGIELLRIAAPKFNFDEHPASDQAVATITLRNRVARCYIGTRRS